MNYNVTFHSTDVNGKHVSYIRSIQSEFCSPKLLVALAIGADVLFVTCDKYGCRQFCNPQRIF